MFSFVKLNVSWSKIHFSNIYFTYGRENWERSIITTCKTRALFKNWNNFSKFHAIRKSTLVNIFWLVRHLLQTVHIKGQVPKLVFITQPCLSSRDQCLVPATTFFFLKKVVHVSDMSDLWHGLVAWSFPLVCCTLDRLEKFRPNFSRCIIYCVVP